MVILSTIIAHLYPQARPLIDYTVTDDGTGQRITHWSDALGLQPIKEELELIVIPPPAKTWPNPAAFWKEFTQAEQVALVSTDDKGMRMLRFNLSLHPTVESDNPELLAGMSYAVSLGLLSEERRVKILSN